MAIWLEIGRYEYEFKDGVCTGWYRCVGGKLADGRWPAWNDQVNRIRYC